MKTLHSIYSLAPILTTECGAGLFRVPRGVARAVAASFFLAKLMEHHTYSADGFCRCIGENTHHNAQGQVYQYAKGRKDLVDYYDTIEEYMQYNVFPDKANRYLSRPRGVPPEGAAAPFREELAFNPVDARKDFAAKQFARMASRK